MLEFKVNDFITLKLEDGETNIYIKGDDEPFEQCKHLLMRKTIFEVKDFLEEIKSVDELVENLDHSLEGVEPELIEIPAETRFWAHCSNMQVWAENNYNTNLLHSNLAFPLLKRLIKLGDLEAQSVFRKEILNRFKLGSFWTQQYLITEGYIDYFTLDDLVNNVFVIEESIKMQEIIDISRDMGITYYLVCSFDDDDLRSLNKPIRTNWFSVKDGYLHELEITVFEDSDINYYITRFENLVSLRINFLKKNNSRFRLKLKHTNIRYLTILFYNEFFLEDIIFKTPKLNHLELGNLSSKTSLNSFTSLASLFNLSGLRVFNFNLNEKIKTYLDTLETTRNHYNELRNCKIYKD